MHLSPLQGNIVEKILTDSSGRLARVSFFVYEHEGRIRARIVNVAYIDEKAPAAPVLALTSGLCLSARSTEVPFSGTPIESPYVDSNFLYSLGSQPRAPSGR